MTTYFQNPANGYIERATGRFTILWAMLFGPFYFAYKGMWLHALLNFLVAIPTVWIGAIIYGFFAPGLVRKKFQHMGWLETSQNQDRKRVPA